MCKAKQREKKGATNFKAAKEKKVKTYLQVSLFSFFAEDEIKPSKTLLSRFSSKAPSPSCLFFFSSLTVTPERKQETPSILRFFNSASLVFFFYFSALFLLCVCSPFFSPR